MLFPALLQGENAINSIIGQMERIRFVKHHFDAVAIIRGGGGDVGLTCYNHYELAKAIALFPLPVITGIGHSTNETVAEMVAFKNAITPTELADFLIQKFHNFSVPVKNAREMIIGKLTRLLSDEKTRILATVRYFRSVTFSRLAQSRNEILQEVKALRQQSAYFLQRRRERDILQNLSLIEKGSVQIVKSNEKVLEGMSKSIELLDPVNVLNRGYSITLVGGKALKTVTEVTEGMVITTILADGNIISTTKSVNKNESDD
jgi:exodeoxyribonuclease VII large subunit